MTPTEPKPYGDVYVITCTVNGKQYVGMTARGVALRWSEHVNCAGKQPWALSRSMGKHGVANFTVRVIDTASSLEELNAKEIHWINLLATRAPSGYNVTEGGLGGTPGMKLTPEHRAKISASQKGKRLSPEHVAQIKARNTGRRHTPEALAKMSAWPRPAWTAERRSKLSKTLTGRKLSPEHRAKMCGKQVSQETREKMSSSARSKPPTSQETKDKLSSKGKGRTFTPEQRAQIAATLKGRPHTPERKAKIIEALRQRTDEQEADRRAKLSAVGRGKPGRAHTPEAKARMSEIHQARWAKLKAGG